MKDSLSISNKKMCITRGLAVLLIGLLTVSPAMAGWGGLLKQVAKDAAKDAAKEKVKEEVVKALFTKASPDYEGPKTYDDALAESMEFSNSMEEISLRPLSNKSDFSNLKYIDKIKMKTKKVSVPGFRVAFITSNAASSTQDNRMLNLGNSAASSSGIKSIHQDETIKMQYLLQGVDLKLMQEITDAAYANFMEKLTASGLEVIPAQTVHAMDAFKEIELAGESPLKKEAIMMRPQDVYIFSPTGLPLFFSHFDKGSYGTVSPLNTKNWKRLNALSVDTGSMMVVPQITINFADVQSSGRSKMFTKAKVSSNNVIHLVPNHTYLVAIFGEKKISGDIASMNLKNSLDVTGEFAVNYLVDETDNASLVNSLTRMTGQPGRITKAETWAVVANPLAFATRAQAGIDAVNAAYISILAN